MIKRYILVAAGEDTFTAIYQKNKLEGPSGFEPPIGELQSLALPLGYGPITA